MQDVYFTTEGERLTPIEVARLLNTSDYVVLFYIVGETEDNYFRFGKFVSLSREINSQDIFNIILNCLLADNRNDILPEDVLSLLLVGITNDSQHVYCDLEPNDVWPTYKELACAKLMDTLHGLKNDGKNDVQ